MKTLNIPSLTSAINDALRKIAPKHHPVVVELSEDDILPKVYIHLGDGFTSSWRIDIIKNRVLANESAHIGICVDYKTKNLYLMVNLEDIKSTFLSNGAPLATNITLRQYSDKLINVFGDNAKVALCFLVATLFKDIVTSATVQFPMLNFFGPGHSGKTALGHSLASFFTSQFNANNLLLMPKAAIADAITQKPNAIVYLDEFRQDIDTDRREFLKSIYDGQVKYYKKNRFVAPAVKSGVIVIGQQMLTYPDKALFNRVIFLQFNKATFSDKERQAYDNLRRIEHLGISHLAEEILKFRSRFESGFHTAWEVAQGDLRRHVEDHGVEPRILHNWCVILAALKTLEGSLDLPFTYNEMLEIFSRLCIEQNKRYLGEEDADSR